MLKIIFLILFSFFVNLNNVSAEVTNDIKAECDTQKFENILNCDYKTVLEKCYGPQSAYDLRSKFGSGRMNFTDYSHNNFLLASLGHCEGSFSNIFEMSISVDVLYKWDAKTADNHPEWDDEIRLNRNKRELEIIKSEEKVNMVLININEIFTTNDDERLIQLYNYLDKNKKIKGVINSFPELIEGKKNFALWSFDESRILLIATPGYSYGYRFYLAYVGEEFVPVIVNSFLKIDEVQTGEGQL